MNPQCIYALRTIGKDNLKDQRNLALLLCGVKRDCNKLRVLNYIFNIYCCLLQKAGNFE